ncbi:MAG: hypothetical protein SFY69_07375 [Planctomycetota bacterium]|nr:hypothetical protein [Planctomycetota bacterium]
MGAAKNRRTTRTTGSTRTTGEARPTGATRAAGGSADGPPPEGGALREQDAWEYPRTPDALHAWIAGVLGVRVARRGIVGGHDAPFDYLAQAFFVDAAPGAGSAGAPAGEGAGEGVSSPDCVVWASRGSGKTLLGAIATVLDLVFKPGIEVRVLGGSLEQSRRMYAHLRRLVDPARSPGLASCVKRATEKRLSFRTGGEVEILAQSQTSVRGTRVHKLRCDEVDLFDAGVWEAAQLVTRSAVCGGVAVRGSVECLSTMHVPHGMMQRLVTEARTGARRLLRWGVVDVLEHCPPRHACERADGRCALWDECTGRAKERPAERAGHVRIDDALAMKRRVSVATWESEMLCRRPRRSDAVIPEFDPVRHVFRGEAPAGMFVAGMDLGIRSATVVLWACVDEEDRVWVVDERSASDQVLGEHVGAMKAGLARAGVPAWPPPAWVGIDPAGRSRNDQTGLSALQVLGQAGFAVRAARRPLRLGLDLLRARFAPASGDARLFIHERCAVLISSLERYHYPTDNPESDEPVKGEGHDHAVDALRYLVQNLDAPGRAGSFNYLKK